MIIATAGHIDHGKTRLVRAITGVDTDRLPEEKARGISIDLGFASWRTPGGEVVGFVDVPGHERFVRNMLAGVCGIDFAMLVVAADDGVMPQTVEHAHILDLLQIRRGIAVVTKTDRVGHERVEQVRQECRRLLAGTQLADVDILAVSASSGEGLERVTAAIAAAADRSDATFEAGRHFRLAIDRAFSVAGSGTVVTGTVFDGEASVGSRLRLSPGGIPVRVRALRVHGSDVERVHAGQRCALNLSGVEVGQVTRGDWVLDEAIHAPTRRVDAELRLLAAPPGAITPATRVHVHLGTGDVLARIAPLRGSSLAPGRVPVQLVFEAPVCALHGDRFIVRDSAAQHTLGGGRVLDPYAPATGRRTANRLAMLDALGGGTAAEALPRLLDVAAGGVALDRFEATFNLRADAAQALYRALDVAIVGHERRVAMTRERHAALSASSLTRLVDHHACHPTALGMRVESLRADVAPSLPLPAFLSLLQELAGAQRVNLSGGVARLPSHDATDNPSDRALWERVLPVLLDAGVHVRTVAELAKAAAVNERALRDLLFRRRSSGAVHRVGDDRFVLRSTLATLAATAASLAAAHGGEFVAAQFRDAVGTGRTRAIELLECLDGLGITLRVGDARRMHHDFVPLLGAAAPLTPPSATRATASAAIHSSPVAKPRRARVSV